MCARLKSLAQSLSNKKCLLVIASLVCCAMAIAGHAPGRSFLWAQLIKPPPISEVVLFGNRPIEELNPHLYPEEEKACVSAYLKAVSPGSYLRRHRAPVDPEQAVKARRRNLEEQIVTIFGEGARSQARDFASAVPLIAEWEGDIQGPLNEADFADQWLERHPGALIAPFLHLFIAHRLRAAYEIARTGDQRHLWPIFVRRYKEALSVAKSSGNALVSCIAMDLEKQSHVYLEGQGRP
jgi:hypothetical protein